MFEPFQQYIGKAAKSHGIGKEVESAKICEDFRKLLPEVFSGKEGAREYIDAGYFKDKILVVEVENPGWAQEVITRKTKIIEEMNRKAGKEIIKNLRTRIKQ